MVFPNNLRIFALDFHTAWKYPMNLDTQFEFLDALPETIFQPVVTLHHGSLQERVAGILAWRRALLKGELPDIDKIGWPEASIAEIIRLRLDGLDLVPFCRNEEVLVDQLLKDICVAITSLLRREKEGVHGLFEDGLPVPHKREREGSQLPDDGSEAQSQLQQPQPQLQSQPLHSQPQPAKETPPPQKNGVSGQSASPMPGMDVAASPSVIENDETISPAAAGDTAEEGRAEEMEESASTLAAPSVAALRQLGDGLAAHWEKVFQHWREVAAVFRGMGSRLGRGWDLSTSELHGTGWREFVAYRKLIRGHPQLVDIVDSLGRELPGEGRGAQAKIMQTHETPGYGGEPTEVFVRRELPLSTSGISRSDDIARMLPQEAAFLGHPKLKMLWHARRAEQGLLSYQVEGVLSEHRPEPLREQSDEPELRREGKRIKGPIILCLDTSASMQGEPERIGKAVCLEVLRLASQSGRRCYLYAFSGPGQVIERELRFDPQGLREILRFLSQSFHGGTDIREPVLRALRKIRGAEWRKADMLLITDGRFPVPASVVDAVRRAREKQQLHLVGLTVGRWANVGLENICQPVHRFEPSSVLAKSLNGH
ncbi:hypothetical protein MNBD_GAMMA20-1752 [hydrothermal vent metagenome]|uniref:VWFA domain-containing protein n=1 Tax=hydrothermal vent metagenome TaxID=652676 RepID=A0A3B1AGM9_9ZZZZ